MRISFAFLTASDRGVFAAISRHCRYRLEAGPLINFQGFERYKGSTYCLQQKNRRGGAPGGNDAEDERRFAPG
jgi:hypothetical protein